MGLFAGVCLTSLATLMLQVSLTRIFSVALWHHFAFMVVSIAFLGFGASGTFLMIAPKIKERPMRPMLAKLALGLSVAGLTSYLCSNRIPFDPARLMWDRYQLVYLLGYYGVFAMPFFFSGLILALVYTHRAESVGRLYAWDLAGAALGCMGIFWIYSLAGGSGAILAVCLLAVLASLAFSSNGWRLNLVRWTWVAMLCLIMVTKPGFVNVNISPYKALMAALRYPDARLLETRWHAAGRLDIIESGAVRFAPGLSLEFRGSLPKQLGLCLDASRLNAVTRFNGNMDGITFTEFLPASLPYAVKEPGDVLIMEPMGGLDILAALYYGARKIVTTHSSPLVIKTMKTSLGPFSGNLYQGIVTSVAEQARSFLGRGRMHFDVIQLPLTDSVGAVSSGLYGLSEDYTLTVEAFQAYIGGLKPDGLFTATVYLLPPPRHEVRLVSLACSALEGMGAGHPERHLAAIRTWGAFTMLVKKSPFEPQEIQRIKDFCNRLRFDLVHYPNMTRAEANVYNRFPGPIYHDIIQKLLSPHDREAFYNEYLFDVRPVTDERPFFYHNFRMDKIASLYHAVGNKWQLFVEGGYLVHLIFLQALVVSLVMIALPLKKTGLPSSSWFLAYFGLIGIAFMFTEICLIQRFILFLARPVYAFSIVLFSVLFASAIGSYCSRKLAVTTSLPSPLKGGGGDRKPLLIKRLGRLPVLAIAPLLLIAYAFLLGRALDLAVGWPFWMRYVAAFFLILPLGFMMGMFFPVGVHTLRLSSRGTIPWAWCVNGCTSVIGSVLAVVIALGYGFKTVLCLAGLSYSLAIVALVFQNLSYHRYKGNPQ